MIGQYQSTIRCGIKFTGVGLHSGQVVNLEILPAKIDAGIVFQRVDQPSLLPVLAHINNVSSCTLSTSIGTGSNSVSTVEHLMAALAGLGIDNALVKIDGPEVPILDGSSAPFVDKILAAGIVKSFAPKKVYVVREAFEVCAGDKRMWVEPSDRARFSYQIDFDISSIGKQSIDFSFTRSSFLKLCESRTFCHVREVEAMRAAGLALGGSLDNAVVVTDTGVMNPEGLRSSDEFVRHKLLDCIGDLALLGAPLIGHVHIDKGGHALHAAFMRELLKHRSRYVTVVDSIVLDKKPAMADGVMAVAAAAAVTN